MANEQTPLWRPSKRYFLYITILTLALFLLINLSQIGSMSSGDITRITLSNYLSEQPPSPSPSSTSRYLTNPAADLTTKTQENLYLRPPSQAWIREQFDKTFQEYGLHHQEPDDWMGCEHDSQTYYFKKIRTIFTGVPKSGCSNWIEALLRAEGILKSKLARTQVYKVHGSLSHKNRMHYIRTPPKDIDFSFTVLRNPWTRMVSGYRDKLSSEVTQGHQKPEVQRRILKEIRGVTDPRELETLHPTFKEYLQFLILHNTTSNIHFTNQLRILCVPQGSYDYVIPLEYSSIMKDEVWSHINTAVELLGSYDSARDPRKQTSALDAREWFSEIDQDIIDKLYELYKPDFMLLNYSNFTDENFPLPLYEL